VVGALTTSTPIGGIGGDGIGGGGVGVGGGGVGGDELIAPL